jgi:glycine cleavage system H lipoate-binding protein
LNVFGSVSTTSSGGAYEHEFSVAENNQHQSLTIGVADDTQDKQFPLAMVNTVEIGAEVGDFVKANIEFRSKK